MYPPRNTSLHSLGNELVILTLFSVSWLVRMCWLPSEWRIRSTEFGLGTPSNCPVSFNWGGDGGGGNCSSTPLVYRVFCNHNISPLPQLTLSITNQLHLSNSRNKHHPVPHLLFIIQTNSLKNSSTTTVTLKLFKLCTLASVALRLKHVPLKPRVFSLSVCTFKTHTSSGPTFGTFKKIISRGGRRWTRRNRSKRDVYQLRARFRLVGLELDTRRIRFRYRRRSRLSTANLPESRISFHYRGHAGLLATKGSTEPQAVSMIGPSVYWNPSIWNGSRLLTNIPRQKFQEHRFHSNDIDKLHNALTLF